MEIGRSKDVSTVLTVLDIAGLQKKPEFGVIGATAFFNLFRHYVVLGCARSDAEFLVENVFGYRLGTRFIPQFDYEYEFRHSSTYEAGNLPRYPDEREVTKTTKVVTDYQAIAFREPRVPIESLVQIPPANRKNGTTGYFFSPNEYSDFSTYTAKDYQTLFPYCKVLEEGTHEGDSFIDLNNPYLCQIESWSKEERAELGL